MQGVSNNSNASGGAANVNINSDVKGSHDSLIQSILSFAMDIPRVVRTSASAWGIAILLIVLASCSAVYLGISYKLSEIIESQERIEKSLVNMHDKYNRIVRYAKTGDPDNFSKDKQD